MKTKPINGSENKRAGLIAGITAALTQTPRRALDQAFGPPVVLIQSEASTDNSFPPELQEIRSDKLCLLTIKDFKHREQSRSPGRFYYAWDAVLTAAGLFMDSRAKFYRAEISGAGTFASFAAHPGNTGVSIQVEYVPADFDLADLTDEDLQILSEELAQALDPTEEEATA